MQNRIFAVWGIGGIGKTTILKLVAREIMRVFSEASCSVQLDPIPLGDITAIISIGDIRIGISTQGDPGTALSKRIRELIEVECMVIFCATRTKGETVTDVEAIEASTNYTYRTTWVTNYQSGFEGEHEELNRLSAIHLVQLMRELCRF